MQLAKWAALTLAVAIASPALAATGWDSYLNQRYGYETAVPPGFSGQGEPDAGDGQVFKGPHGDKLTVWGGYLADGTFDEDVAGRQNSHQHEGWTISYQATTPSWASYSGSKGQRILYVREISGCKGENYATFEFEYAATEINAMKPVVERLVKGLKQVDCQ